MSRIALFALLVLAASTVLHARVLRIGPGEYSGLEAAAAVAQPGDTIMFLAGTHAGGAHVSQLRGTAARWITIMGDPSGATLIEGGGTAFQLSDPSFLRISGLRFDGQTANGVNIDDGGSFDTPATNIIIEHCSWLGIDATGNNDQLKLSGLDDFIVRHCSFRDGSPGGSMIDMVGCHDGVFEDNRFENGGSNCIQAKGGSSDLRITRNLFLGGGQRAINIGGSTGLAYFRPQDADYEAADITIWANVFTGAVAPVAYVGAVRCTVMNNTLYLPEKWAVRILQESTDARFLQCGDNTFANNLVLLDNAAAAPTFNIGPNTRPESFTLTSNLWYNLDDPGWQGPNSPVTDAHAIVGRNPLLVSPAMRDGDFTPGPGSPAIAAGVAHSEQRYDLYGRAFRAQPSIGAVEGDTLTQHIGHALSPALPRLEIWPQPASSRAHVRISGPAGSSYLLTLHDIRGRRVSSAERAIEFGGKDTDVILQLDALPAGYYFLLLTGGAAPVLHPMLVQ